MKNLLFAVLLVVVLSIVCRIPAIRFKSQESVCPVCGRICRELYKSRATGTVVGCNSCIVKE